MALDMLIIYLRSNFFSAENCKCGIHSYIQFCEERKSKIQRTKVTANFYILTAILDAMSM